MEKVLIKTEYRNRKHGTFYPVRLWAYAIDSAPGLTFHHSMGANGMPLHQWCITHIASGRVVGDPTGYATIEQVIGAAEELAQGVDWTQAAVVLNEYTDEQGCGRVAITG